MWTQSSRKPMDAGLGAFSLVLALWLLAAALVLASLRKLADLPPASGTSGSVEERASPPKPRTRGSSLNQTELSPLVRSSAQGRPQLSQM